MLGIQPKFQTCEKQNNRENKTPKVKQSHAQDSIYVVQQFAYVHRVAGISQNPNHQKNGFYILRTGFTMDYKTG